MREVLKSKHEALIFFKKTLLSNEMHYEIKECQQIASFITNLSSSIEEIYCSIEKIVDMIKISKDGLRRKIGKISELISEVSVDSNRPTSVILDCIHQIESTYNSMENYCKIMINHSKLVYSDVKLAFEISKQSQILIDEVFDEFNKK